MATRRSTFGKRDREMAKLAKAQAKRARRDSKPSEDETAAPPVDDDGTSAAELLERLEALHAEFDAGRVTFDDFEAEKSELSDRIALRLSQD